MNAITRMLFSAHECIIIVGLVLMLAGCETPEQTGLLGAALTGLSPYAKTAQGAASMAGMGQAASGYANAQAGKTTVVIQGAAPTSGSVGTPIPDYALPSSAPVVEAEQSGVLNVITEIEGCDVIIDGAFVGNTPAKLKLPQGLYVIEVRKNGYKPYKKEILVSKGSELSLRPTLEKE